MFARSLTTSVRVRSELFKTISVFSELKCSFHKCIMESDKFKMPERYAEQAVNVWVEYAALAAKHHPINLGQGFPDFAAPKVVTKALIDIANDENVLLHQYTRGFVSYNFRLYNN